jgi:hypothetical protein
MRVRNSNVQCERVSSLFDVGSSMNDVEIGWYEHGPNGPPSLRGETSGVPMVFWAAQIAGIPACHPFVVVSSGLGHNFRVEDANRDSRDKGRDRLSVGRFDDRGPVGRQEALPVRLPP